MSKVLPLTRWKDKSLAEREEFSDEEDSEDEDNEVEEFTIPLKSRKRKISSSGKKRSHGCGFQKNLRASDVRKSLPVHLRVHQGDHDICRKRRK